MRFSKLVCISVFLLFLLALTPQASASQIISYDVEIEMESDRIALVSGTVIYSSLSTNKVPLLFTNSLFDFSASDVLGNLDCSISGSSIGTEALCKPNLPRSEVSIDSPYELKFSFRTSSLVFKQDNPLVLFIYVVADPTDSIDVRMLLPERSILPLSSESLQPYSPSSADIKSDGRRVILEWHIDKPQLGSRLNFSAQYEKALFTPFIITISALLFLVMVLLFVLYYRIKHMKTKAVISVLKGDEKKVVDVITSEGGSCKQREIVRKTDFSKAKVSRIITLLEERGIVKKDRKGRTNKVMLSENNRTKKKENDVEEKNEEKGFGN